MPSTATVAEARDVLADTPVLPVALARPVTGPVVVAEILGSVGAAALSDAPDDDPVGVHVDQPLPVVGVTEELTVAVRRIRGHRGPVVVSENGRAAALVDADVVRTSSVTWSAAIRHP